MILMMALPMIIPAALLTVNFILSSTYASSREKPSPFECGFDPPAMARLPFSIRFYLITVIFLIFDVEITLILPVPILSVSLPTPHTAILTSFFILILLLGLFNEWKFGALEWKI